MSQHQSALPTISPAAARFRAPDHPAIVPVRAFSDNYIWLIGGTAPGEPAAVVDPGDAAPVIAALEKAGRPLAAILITHHHRDHTGGIDALRERWPDVRVIGPWATDHAGITERVDDGDTVSLAAPALEARVIAVPGHTLDHIAYHCRQVAGLPGDVLFCGDTMFAAGCGRLFEGSPEQMLASLNRLAALPPATTVYCAHEYTLANLVFARAAEPDSPVLAERLAEARQLRDSDIPTVPSTIAIERATNPFLRSDTAGIVASLASRDAPVGSPAARFAALRGWKDVFRG